MALLEIEFFGASGTVTGSRTLLKSPDTSVLVDCGLFQGTRDLRNKNWERPDSKLIRAKSIVLTHAHLDHSGFLPRLVRQGFQGPIHVTHATADLLSLLLLDSAKIQEEDARYANESGHSRHKPAEPLYRVEDVEPVLSKLVRHDFGSSVTLSPSLSVVFHRAGHILGSSFLSFESRIGEAVHRLCMSGDLGRANPLLLKGPESPGEMDTLVLESTYGGRFHPKEEIRQAFASKVLPTLQAKGVVVIPSFAVGRAQDLLYLIRLCEDAGLIPSVPVLLDTPMGVAATDLLVQYPNEHALNSAFATQLYPKQYEEAHSSDESMVASMRDGPLFVVSASGMLSGGRVLHHLKKRLGQENNLVLFVGYQAEGTKGRFLLHKPDAIRIHHQEISVQCGVSAIDGLSAHADESELLSWVRSARRLPSRVILNHGEDEAREKLALALRSLGIPRVELSRVDQPMVLSSQNSLPA
jgi:metallo-beta-lactamase family protein